MGGRLGHLLTRRVLAAGLPAPLHLFASGCAAPSAAENRRRYQLPRDEFFAMLEGMDCPPQVLENEELMEVFEPVLRADFEANDTYVYKREAPFDVPVTVMIGTEEETSREEALRWQEETVQDIALTEFSGGHFFIFDHLSELGGIVSRALSGDHLDLKKELTASQS
jgi:surfactin synthase thioesterase subunit